MKTIDVLRERMTRQGLSTRTPGDASTAATLGVALQAQDLQASRLGVRARTTGTSETGVASSCDVQRRVVRTWLMRGTVHLVAVDDLRWMSALFGPMIARRYAKRWLDLGLTPTVLDAAAEAMPAVLAAGPLNRHEIVAALGERGVVIDSTGQAPSHLVLFTSTIGLTCRGPDRGRETTFALLEQWVPDGPAGPRGEDALAEITRRYFTAFGPATATDFTAWSGLPSNRAIAAIRDELVPVEVHGRPGWRFGSVAAVSALRLLPAFDNYVLGHRHREHLLDPTLRGRVFDGGMIHPTVVQDGRVVGTWKLSRRVGAAQIAVTPFEAMSRATRKAIADETDDVGAFIGLPVSLSFAE